MLETLICRTHKSFSSDAVYTFAVYTAAYILLQYICCSIYSRHFPLLQIPVSHPTEDRWLCCTRDPDFAAVLTLQKT